MKILFIILIILPIGFTSAKSDHLHFEDPYLAKCHVTNLPKTNDPVPLRFSSTNNLTENWPGINEFDDQNYFIEGKLLDEKCVPIRDAIIYAWQPNFPSNLKNKLSSNDNSEIIPGTASSVTNNLGQFSFFSSTKNTRLTELNLLITHPDFPRYITKVLLSNNNDHIITYRDGNKFSFNITLKNSNKHQRF